jgi:hypothetical protein
MTVGPSHRYLEHFVKNIKGEEYSRVRPLRRGGFSSLPLTRRTTTRGPSRDFTTLTASSDDISFSLTWSRQTPRFAGPIPALNFRFVTIQL